MRTFLQDQIVSLRFENLEGIESLSHLVTTRLGGVSVGPFAQLNLSFRVGDGLEAVLENRRRVLSLLDCKLKSLVTVEQPHEGRFCRVGEGECGRGAAEPESALAGLDGLWTTEKGVALMVCGADCPLVILYHPAEVIALLHSSWRCTFRMAAERLVLSVSKELGIAAEEWLAGISPSIGVCCYEVGQEFLEKTALVPGGKSLITNRKGRLYFNLSLANFLQLQRAGIPEERIEVANLCTSCRGDLFYSYRRDGARTGRIGALTFLR